MHSRDITQIVNQSDILMSFDTEKAGLIRQLIAYQGGKVKVFVVRVGNSFIQLLNDMHRN